MQRKIKLVIAYDGTDFHGWQAQTGLRTVQEEFQGLLARVVRHPLFLIGASRTDAGVHARGQVAHFTLQSEIPVVNLRRALEDRLPPDISLVHAVEVAPEFHATRDALGKLYRYTLYNAPGQPVRELAQRHAWHVWHPLDVERMRAAAAALVGKHDFAGLANVGSPRETTVRTIFRIGIQRRYHQVAIDVVGDGFMYNQVRVMVGTLVEIGRGHWPPARAAEILESNDRSRAGPTAPAHGLTLQWVRYAPTWSIPHGA